MGRPLQVFMAQNTRPALSLIFALLLTQVGTVALAQATVAAETAPAVIRQPTRDAPELATGFNQKPVANAKQSMVAAAHPLAVEAGLKMLDQGGSAIDAAIAVQMVLS